MKAPTTISSILEEFEKFKCIRGDCAGGGHTFPTDDEPEGGQCQFCAEYLFPMRDFIKSHLESLLDEVEARCEEVEKLKHTNTRTWIAGYATHCQEIKEFIASKRK
jgi:ribosomal protein S17E